jgi:hypothetical protein
MEDDQRSEELRRSCAHWRRMATEEKARGEYNRERGETDVVQRNREDLFNKCAESIELQLKTGVPHCVCHLIPMSDCAKNAQSSRKQPC